MLLLEEDSSLVQARNEASIIVFEGLAQYVTDGLEPVLEGETKKYYEHVMGRRCGHPRAYAGESGCTLCGFCWHRRIVRENAGQHNEIQYCDFCGEEKSRVWRESDDGYSSYHGF
jgi:ribosomal protein L37E